MVLGAVIVGTTESGMGRMTMTAQMRTLGVTLMVAMMVVWGGVGSGVPRASAGAKEVKPRAPIPETGQTTCWDASGTPILCAGTGQDGDLRAGVAWPVPRFTDRGNGTVRDNLTGLIWLQNANCFGSRQQWADALTDANTLASPSCGLSDASVAGDWQLPNVRELQSLIDFGHFDPALPQGHPFAGVQATWYWSSTASADSPGLAWGVALSDGTTADIRGFAALVWPVRGGD
jgi:hypothetical protein